MSYSDVYQKKLLLTCPKCPRTAQNAQELLRTLARIRHHHHFFDKTNNCFQAWPCSWAKDKNLRAGPKLWAPWPMWATQRENPQIPRAQSRKNQLSHIQPMSLRWLGDSIRIGTKTAMFPEGLRNEFRCPGASASSISLRVFRSVKSCTFSSLW